VKWRKKLRLVQGRRIRRLVAEDQPKTARSSQPKIEEGSKKRSTEAESQSSEEDRYNVWVEPLS
jgi:hypothetical protein